VGLHDIRFDANEVRVSRVFLEECRKTDALVNRFNDCFHRTRAECEPCRAKFANPLLVWQFFPTLVESDKRMR